MKRDPRANPSDPNSPRRTQQQVAEIIGTTRANVQQIEKNALRKMKESLESDPFIRDILREGLRP